MEQLLQTDLVTSTVSLSRPQVAYQSMQCQFGYMFSSDGDQLAKMKRVRYAPILFCLISVIFSC